MPLNHVLFHTGYSIIDTPDIHYGRKNADFGQGFYLSADGEFSRRWARERKDSDTYLNQYELDDTGLLIKRFVRDEEWFDYLYKNRAGYPDGLQEYDVVVGPIANDTIYDTWGIITSGLLEREQALKLLTIGPAYEQIVIKTARAAEALHFVSYTRLLPGEIKGYREIVRREEAAFQEAFAHRLEELLKEE